MKENVGSWLFVIAVVVIVVILPLRWRRRQRIARVAKQELEKERSRRHFEQRQLRPDFAAFVQQFSCEPPSSLRQLYEDAKTVIDGGFDVHLPMFPAPFFIAWFEPMDKEQMSIVWRGAEGYYSFANDGCDNRYLVNPNESDPEVCLYDHETGKRQALGASLSQFLAARRTKECGE